MSYRDVLLLNLPPESNKGKKRKRTKSPSQESSTTSTTTKMEQFFINEWMPRWLGSKGEAPLVVFIPLYFFVQITMACM